MRSRCALSIAFLLLLAPLPAPAISLIPQTAPPSPQEQEAFAAYLRDPAANAKAYMDAIRDESGAVRPLQALFLGDAALRVGRYRMATDVFEAVRDTGDPTFGSLAEVGLAAAALGRGRLPDASEHLPAGGGAKPRPRASTRGS